MDFRRGFRRFDRRKCSLSLNYHRWHCAEDIIWRIKEFDVEEEIYGHWEFTGCSLFDVRFKYHLHLDESWSVIALAIVFR